MGYKLQNRSIANVICDVFNKTAKSTVAFVGSSVATGVFYGEMTDRVIEDVVGHFDITAIPHAAGFLLSLYASVYLAKNVYENFKKDRERLHNLSLEIDKEKQRKREANEQAAIEKELTAEQIYKDMGFESYDIEDGKLIRR